MPAQNKIVAVDTLYISSRSRGCGNCGKVPQTLDTPAFAPLEKL
jgi:hypothetical protein